MSEQRIQGIQGIQPRIIKYTKLNANSVKGELLIHCKKKHISILATKFLNSNIIPIEYIDEKLRLEYIKNKKELIINNSIRLEYIINLLNKECSKTTAKLISDMCK